MCTIYDLLKLSDFYQKWLDSQNSDQLIPLIQNELTFRIFNFSSQVKHTFRESKSSLFLSTLCFGPKCGCQSIFVPMSFSVYIITSHLED